MKISEILKLYLHETPVIISGGAAYDKNMPTSFISDSALEREYDLIFTVPSIRGTISLYWNKSKQVIHGVIPVEKSEGKTNQIIFRLEFKNSYEIDFDTLPSIKDILPIKWVNTHKDFQNIDIASKVYQNLAKKGFTIVSDSLQLEGGRKLWKKIARDFINSNLPVYIWNTDTKEFIKDETGKEIRYDSANIPDEHLWTIEPDYDGEIILLTLNKNNKLTTV